MGTKKQERKREITGGDMDLSKIRSAKTCFEVDSMVAISSRCVAFESATGVNIEEITITISRDRTDDSVGFAMADVKVRLEEM